MSKSLECLLILIAFFVVQQSAPASLAQRTTMGALQGRVVQEDTNSPISDVLVSATNEVTGLIRTVLTDSQGEFFIGHLPPGSYLIQCRAAGYESASFSVPVRMSQTNPVLKALKVTRVSGDELPPKIELTSPKIDRGAVLELSKNRINIAGRVLAQSEVNTLIIQGMLVEVGKDGSFTTEILLRGGENLITVTAVDARRKWSKEEFTVLRRDETVAPPPDMSALLSLLKSRQYYALVIGNRNYQHLKPLETPEEDAKKVAEVLGKEYGFIPKLLLDATREQILFALEEYRIDLTPDASLLIYYAGHGHFDSEAGKAYWQSVDSNSGNTIRSVSADEVTTFIKKIRARQVLVISDSCYSGALTRESDRIIKRTRERQALLIKVLERRSRVLVSSGGNEPVMDGGGGGHSVFARAVLRGLIEMDSDIFTSLDLFYKFIWQPVGGNSNQVPQYKFIVNSGHDDGDFIFRRKR